ncbi:MAG: winged helix-turn-helix transcriptional regulator [Candidatus Thermoplasmatota archaeon]
MSEPRLDRVLWASLALATLLGLAPVAAMPSVEGTVERVENSAESLPGPPAPPEPEDILPTPEVPTVREVVETLVPVLVRARAEVEDAVASLPDAQPLLAEAERKIGDARSDAEELAHEVPDSILSTSRPMQTESTAEAPADAPSAFAPIVAAASIVVAGAGATLFAFWLAGSSGSVSVGASAVAGKDLRKLLPFASPLFTRFSKETVLGHPRREALYALILQNPGISLQALGDGTGLSRTAVLHHLRLLEQQHIIVSIRKGRSRHYYENGGRFGHDQKDAYAVLQNGRSKEIAAFIRAHPGTLQKALCEGMGIQPSIAHWHVRRLVDARLVESIHKGRTVSYFPAAALTGLQAPVPAEPLAAAAPMTA